MRNFSFMRNFSLKRSFMRSCQKALLTLIDVKISFIYGCCVRSISSIGSCNA